MKNMTAICDAVSGIPVLSIDMSHVFSGPPQAQ